MADFFPIRAAGIDDVNNATAVPFSTSRVSCHALDIDDIDEVTRSLKPCRAEWLSIGLALKVRFGTIEAIRKDPNNRSIDDMLIELMAAWLRKDIKPLRSTKPPTWRSLCHALQDINFAQAEAIGKNHVCDCELCCGLPADDNAMERAKRLVKTFESLLLHITEEIKQLNKKVYELRFQLSSYFRRDENLDSVIEDHLQKIESLPTPAAILNYFFRYGFIGCINYSLIKVFQAFIKSSEVNHQVEKYEEEYRCFIQQVSLKEIHSIFDTYPDIRPKYPVGIPKLFVHLNSQWEGKNMFELQELLMKRFNWPDNLMIVDISRGSIIIVFCVFPHLVDKLSSAIDTNALTAEGISVELSPSFLQWRSQSTTNTTLRQQRFSAERAQPHMNVKQFYEVKGENFGGVNIRGFFAFVLILLGAMLIGTWRSSIVSSLERFSNYLIGIILFNSTLVLFFLIGVIAVILIFVLAIQLLNYRWQNS